MKKIILSLITFSTLISTSTFAGLFKIENRQFTNVNDATITAYLHAFLDRLEEDVNKKLPAADASNYLRGIADSSVTSGAGMGVDYASPFSLALLGVQAGAGAKLGKGNSTRKLIKGDVKAENIQGVGAQAALMAGFNLGFLPNINLGFFDTERLKLFGHLFLYKFNMSDVNIKTTSFGFHGQYNMLRPRKWALGLVRWGGLDVTTGFKMSNLRATISKTLKETRTETITIPSPATTINATGSIEGTANVGTIAKTYTIPLEVSSNIRLAYILGFFGGLGMDISFGSAKANASVAAPFSFSTQQGYGGTGTATLNLGQKKGPHIVDVRYFVGPHIELGIVSLYAQYTQAFISKTIGVNAGLKAFW